MSLTAIERVHTKKELAANFKLANVSKKKAANDLGTTPQHLTAVLELHGDRIEEPWILRNYLNQKIHAQNLQPIPYSKLQGDPATYWFLDAAFIARGQLE